MRAHHLLGGDRALPYSSRGLARLRSPCEPACPSDRSGEYSEKSRGIFGWGGGICGPARMRNPPRGRVFGNCFGTLGKSGDFSGRAGARSVKVRANYTSFLCVKGKFEVFI